MIMTSVFWITLAFASVLAFTHFIVPHIKRLESVDTSILNSIAGGLGLGAVLIHLLPDLMASVSKLSAQTTIAFFHKPEHLFFGLCTTILISFCLTYALEKIAHDRKKKGQDPEDIIYHLHLLVLCSMLFVMIATFPTLLKVSIFGLALITILLMAEIIMEDHAFQKHFGEIYGFGGRSLVVLSIFGGWAFGYYVVGSQTSLHMAFTTAFAVGVFLLTVVKTEFDLLEEKSHFPTFLLSVFIKVCIVCVLLFLEYQHEMQHHLSHGS